MSSNEAQNTDSTVQIAASLVSVADPTKWTLIENRTVGGDDNARESLFERNDAPPERPEHLRVGSYPAKGGKFNASIRWDYWNKHTNDDSEVTYEKNSMTLAFTTERQPLLASADSGFVVRYMNFFSIILGNTSSGTPDYDGIDRLSRGITDMNFAGLTRT